jgi:outer membrane lipoprotein-sorting protein
VICALASLAWADPADDLLAKVEAANHQASDAHITLTVTASDSGGDTSRTLEIWQKGEAERLVKFTAPARLAGVALLVPDGSTVYLYLPAYHNVRRIVGESRGDAFLGTDFAMDDLARLAWHDDYTPALLEADHLRLTPREGANAASASVDLWVRPDDGLLVRVEHHDASGAVVRRISFDDFRTVQGHPLAHAITVEDVWRGRTTKAVVSDVAFDTGLSDDVFAVSELNQ